MRTYVIRRILLVVPTLFLVTIIVFAVVRMIPGDVIDVIMASMPELGTSVDRERIEQMLGLDLPVHVQYARWIGGVLQGDLGTSLRGEQAITPDILARLPVTFELEAFAVMIGLLIALPIGIYSVIRQNTIGNYAGRGIVGGISGSRIARSAVIGIKENVYFLAARAVGVPTRQILFRHVLPNIMAPMIVIFTVTIGDVIIAEASLSFLGLGLPPDVASWGGMLSWEGRRYMERVPALALWPGFSLFIVVWGTNMFGDALRDLLDPSLRGGVGRYGGFKGKKIKKFGTF